MTNPGTQREAQQRVERIKAFRAELSELEKEGALLLSGEQRRSLDQHLETTLSGLAREFDVDISDTQKRFSWGMRLASTLGGLALCAAVVLFFYRIWGILPVPGQFLLLLATPLGAVAATEFAARREKTLYYASLLALVAIAGFILNLTALGSILNLAESPHVMLIWGSFALALAYAYGLRLALLVALVCLLDYSACLFSMAMGGHWMDHLRHPECFAPGALAALALPCVFPHKGREGFSPIYRGAGLAILFFALLLLSLSGQMSYFGWTEHAVEVFYQVLGIAGFAALTALAVRRGWMETVYLGSAFFGVLIYVRLFDWWWEWMPKYLFFFIIGLISLSLLALFRKIRSRAPRRGPPG